MVELEGLIHGLSRVIQLGLEILVVEGDSKIILRMAGHLMNWKSVSKVSPH